MDKLSNSIDEVVECPLCMEPLEVDDLNFFPCTCGYQICRFCWHRIRTDENELCPACRKEYPENPADFKPLTQEEMIAFKSQKRQRDQQRKQRITENRKHLANVRVVQKNLVFVVGLPPRLADADILKKHEYFGKYGKIHKVVINPSTTYAGVQGPSASAYVTYVNNMDASRAIQSVNNITIDGRQIKTSLGTTKYCSHFMKNQLCPKGDCMYLHELGDPEASFTKEEMYQGKHQEYEKRLHEVLNTSNLAVSSACNGTTTCNTSSSVSSKVSDTSKTSVTAATSTAISTSTSNTTSQTTTASMPPTHQKDAWPSLCVSPVTAKETNTATNTNGNGRNKKERNKQNAQDKTTKSDKNAKTKTKTVNTNGFPNSTKENENFSSSSSSNQQQTTTATAGKLVTRNEVKSDKNKEKQRSVLNRQIKKQKSSFNVAGELINDSSNGITTYTACEKSMIIDDHPFSGTSSSNSSSSCENTSTTNENTSEQFAKISKKHDSHRYTAESDSQQKENKNQTQTTEEQVNGLGFMENNLQIAEENTVRIRNENIDDTGNVKTLSGTGAITSSPVEKSQEQNLNDASNTNTDEILQNGSKNLAPDTSNNANLSFISNNLNIDEFAKMSLLDGKSYFSSISETLQQNLPPELDNSNEKTDNPNSLINNIATSHLPDLINGIDGYQNITATNDWENAFQNILSNTGKQFGEHFPKDANDYNEQLQEINKTNLILSSLGLSQPLLHNQNITHIPNSFLANYNLYTSATALPNDIAYQQSHTTNPMLYTNQMQQTNSLDSNGICNSLFGSNMSKFFDFHKNQQKVLNSINNSGSAMKSPGQLCDNIHMLKILENNHFNSQYMDSNSQLTSQQQQQQQQIEKDNLFGKIDQMLYQQNPQTMQNSSKTSLAQNQNADDDLGFDPFIETQKALAELIATEEVKQNSAPSESANSSRLLQYSQQYKQSINNQQQILDCMQRVRMPPPGFQHVNPLEGRNVQTTSKILPLINMNENGLTAAAADQLNIQPQLQLLNNVWNTHLGFAIQNNPVSDTQLRQMNSYPAPNRHAISSKGYTCNDWTAMDPAILSLRQFSNYPQQSQLSPHLQQQNMFVRQVSQSQNALGGYNSQAQLQVEDSVLSNSILNSQQNSPAYVNANVQGMLEYLKNRQFV